MPDPALAGTAALKADNYLTVAEKVGVKDLSVQA
jgi:hypothetical protein